MKKISAPCLLSLILLVSTACSPGSEVSLKHSPTTQNPAVVAGAAAGAEPLTADRFEGNDPRSSESTSTGSSEQLDPSASETESPTADTSIPRDPETRATVMRQRDADGGLAFATFYFLSLLEAVETLDTSTVMELAGGECQICLADIMAINAAASADFPVEFSSVLPSEALQATELGDAHYRFDATMAYIYYSSPGSAPFLPYTVDQQLPGFFEVKHGAEGWQMLDYDAYAQDEER